MKYEVVKKFTDIHTKEKYVVGAILELAEDRVKEINATENLLKCELIKKIKVAAKTKKPKAD